MSFEFEKYVNSCMEAMANGINEETINNMYLESVVKEAKKRTVGKEMDEKMMYDYQTDVHKCIRDVADGKDIEYLHNNYSDDVIQDANHRISMFGIARYINKDCDKKEEDMVNHPPHYQSDSGIEVIDVIEGFVDDFESYCLGNVIKYILRYRNKNGLEDLQKAEWYLKKLIAIRSVEE